MTDGKIAHSKLFRPPVKLPFSAMIRNRSRSPIIFQWVTNKIYRSPPKRLCRILIILLIFYRLSFILGTLSKPRRRRQRGHGKTKDLIGRTITQHTRFKSSKLLPPPTTELLHLKLAISRLNVVVQLN